MKTSVRIQIGSSCRTPTSARRFGRLGFVYGALAVAGLIFPGQTVRAEGVPLTVLVYNYTGASAVTLFSAEREAARILDSAGASVVWVNSWDKRQLSGETGELCAKGWTSQTHGLKLISGMNKFLYKEFGVASIPVYATIYYEEVARRAHNDNSASELPILLGCVIAHELGHLLGVRGHSTSGIMQPQWGASQIRQALMESLLFLKEQKRVIRDQVLMAANR
jgi:hypothetical protein